jgi:hypothetical protein
MEGQYIRIVRWHVIRTPTRMFDTYVTLCGRRASGKPSNDRDLLLCETCLRIAEKP